MKVRYAYINLFVLILGFFSLQSTDLDSFSNLFLDEEIEELIYDSYELDFEKQLSDYDDGDNGSVSSLNTLIKNPFTTQVDIKNPEPKDLPKKSNLFILYCCLKIDC